MRHALLAVTFGAMLLLPIASIVAPPVHVMVPVAGASHEALLAATDTIEAIPAVVVATDHAGVTSATQQESRFSLSVLLLAGWIFGTAVFLLPVVTGLWQIRSLRRSGLPWLHGHSVTEALAVDAGIHRRVEVLLHEALPGPITCGVLHPIIVLPQDAETWEVEDLNRAIVHELEHVRRGDSVTRCLARAICALYWFHPLAWVARRKLVLEAERSCDDAVLRRSEATAYADQLVGLAKRLPLAQRSPLLAMANRSDLAARVGAVLDSRQRRGRAGTCPVAIACAAAAVLVIVMSPLMLIAAPQAQPRPSFEVASVKPIDRATMQRDHQGRLFDREAFVDRTDLMTFIVRAYLNGGGSCLLKNAFGEDCPVIVGTLPAWVRTERWEIQAKLPANLPNYTARQLREESTPEFNLMLQVLLEDRFHLKVHREMKELPVYALTVGKNGPKLKPTPPGGELRKAADGSLIEVHGIALSNRTEGRGRLQFQASSMQDTAGQLALYFDRPVVDRTGLNGEYDFVIEFEVEPSGPEPVTVDKSSGLGGGMFNPYRGMTYSALSIALQDVGLRLESTKAPVEVLVIDHVEKPSDN